MTPELVVLHDASSKRITLAPDAIDEMEILRLSIIPRTTIKALGVLCWRKSAICWRLPQESEVGGSQHVARYVLSEQKFRVSRC